VRAKIVNDHDAGAPPLSPHLDRPEPTMTDERPRMTLGSMVALELALGGLGLLLGAIFSVDPLQTVARGPEQLLANLGYFAWGAALAVPLQVLMQTLDRLDLAWFRDIRDALDQHLLPLLRDVDWAGLAALSLAAGVGEEILFRGFLQTLLESWLGPVAALLLASALFGAAHFVSVAYFWVAAAIGLVMGLVFWWSQSLVVPAAMHGFYDFLALLYLRNTAAAEAADRDDVDDDDDDDDEPRDDR
jgi:membrane protease YdiL (CAAX protease family)